jgi:hypothetical protein
MSISSKAVLVVLSISGIPDFRKQDKKVSDEVAKQHKSKRELGVYNKHLIDPKAESFSRLREWATKVREWHYEHTTPFAHNGARFLKATEIFPYQAQMTKFGNEGHVLFDDFLADYERLKSKAKRELNGLYNEADYPSEGKLRSRFFFEHTLLPAPDSNHVVLDLVAEDVAESVKKSTEAAMKHATAEAMRDVWVRLHEVTQNMAAALAEPDRRFHDTLVSNVKDLCDILPGLNLVDDPVLDQIGQEVKKSLTKSKPETLREDPDKRAEVAKKAAALAAKMSAFVK